jgi:hypothetical protein
VNSDEFVPLALPVFMRVSNVPYPNFAFVWMEPQEYFRSP